MDVFLGQLMLFPFGHEPTGWALCNGQEMAINQNPALFALLGTRFGGNGIQTFALPNLQGRAPIMPDPDGSIQLGGSGGEEFHKLTVPEIPVHNHNLMASSAAEDSPKPAGHSLATPTVEIYANTAASEALAGGSISSAGGNKGHENRQPYLVLNWCIALQGIFPSRG
jgi:microcystin-dependent protein